jgi:hypothetical protein
MFRVRKPTPNPAADTNVAHTGGPAVLIPTGLSDEEDAGRYLQQKFDKLIGFCRNCEGTFTLPTRDGVAWCPYCLKNGINEFLCYPGTAPYSRRLKR